MRDIFTSEEKDEVLNLCDTKGCQIELSDSDEKDLQYKAIAKILEQDGFIKLTLYIGGAVYWLTEKGFVFKNRGGFTALEKQKRLEEVESKESEKQLRIQEIEIQRLISEQLMEKDHSFQERQNKANRKNAIVSGLIAAVISTIITLVMQSL